VPKLTSFAVFVACLAIAFAVYRGLNPGTITVIQERLVPVHLSTEQLDSMKLAFYTEFKGTLKPQIIKIADSTRIGALLGEVFALRDSLKGKAKLELVYYNENQPPYGDTLGARADFVSDSMSVVFRPKARDFQVVLRDTISIPAPGGGFWDTAEKVGLVAGGFVIRGLLK